MLFLNYQSNAVEVVIKEFMVDLLSGKDVLGITELERFGVMILEKNI